jgi:hypothetical protein
MLRRLCIVSLMVLPTAFAGASSVARANPLTTCDSPADSALNQYCETIPSTGGGQRPSTGMHALATTLPPTLVSRILASGPASGRASPRALLTLPAPVREARPTPTGPTGAAIASTQPLSAWIIAVLALVALALAGGTVAERRRRRIH